MNTYEDKESFSLGNGRMVILGELVHKCGREQSFSLHSIIHVH